MANSLIAHNVDRQPRILAPLVANGAGEVRIKHYQTVQAEAQAIVADIRRKLLSGVQPGEIIVLSQRKTFAIPIYTLLRQQGVPAKSYYAETALHSKEAQERFAILKAVFE